MEKIIILGILGRRIQVISRGRIIWMKIFDFFVFYHLRMPLEGQIVNLRQFLMDLILSNLHQKPKPSIDFYSYYSLKIYKEQKTSHLTHFILSPYIYSPISTKQ
jgi:hypothetical protein